MQVGKPVTQSQGLRFPKDHGPHLEQGIEWWYVTANLRAKNGQTFGVQWTLFRVSVEDNNEIKNTSPWWDGQFYFAHFAIQNNEQHVAFEKYGRAGQVTIEAFPFIASIDNWQLASEQETFLPLSLTASQQGQIIKLHLSDSPIVKHGDNGFSQKTHQGHASYYYSYPFLNVTGEIDFNNQTYEVEGSAWLDREWSSGLIDNNHHSGWDWFSIQADEQHKGGVMAFCLRDQSNRYDYCSASVISKGGEVTKIEHKQVKLTTLDTTMLDNKQYPIKWQLLLPEHTPIIIEAKNKDSRNQLSIPYWEGRIRSTGGFNGKGYAELVGY